MQIGNKKTTLKDNAALYNHQTDGMSEKEKFRSLKGRKKWVQFRDYYLLKIVAIVAVLAFVASLVFTVLAPKPETVFYAAVFDNAVRMDKVEELQAAFNEKIGIDPETQETTFDNTFYYYTDEYGSMQKFTVYLAVGQMSVAIMPQSVFEKIAVNSCFKPLSEVLSTDSYLKLSDRFVMSAINDSNGNPIENSEKAYGINLDNTRFFSEEQMINEPAVLAICASWENDSVCKEFIEFLLK